MILDTTFVIDVMRNEPKAILKLGELTKKCEPQFLTSLTIFELFTGLSRSVRPEHEKTKITALLEGQAILNLDKESAEKAGEIDGSLIKDGIPIDPIDSMIAGIAVLKNEKIITRNVKHFSRVSGLKIEEY